MSDEARSAQAANEIHDAVTRLYDRVVQAELDGYTFPPGLFVQTMKRVLEVDAVSASGGKAGSYPFELLLRLLNEATADINDWCPPRNSTS